MAINNKTKLGVIFKKYPKAAELLMTKFGLHCVGCFAASFETLEQGACAHGMSKKEIEKMVEELNSVVASGDETSRKGS